MDFSSNSYILAAGLPPDLDTTATALSVLHKFGKLDVPGDAGGDDGPGGGLDLVH